MFNVVIWGLGARGKNLALALDDEICKISFCKQYLLPQPVEEKKRLFKRK